MWPEEADRAFHSIRRELAASGAAEVAEAADAVVRDLRAQVLPVAAADGVGNRGAPLERVVASDILPPLAAPPAIANPDPVDVAYGQRVDPVLMQDAYDEANAGLRGVAARGTVTRNWHNDVLAAYAADELYGPLRALVLRDGAELSLQDRSRIKHYRVVHDLLYSAPKGVGEYRLCVPVSEGNALRLVMLFYSHEGGVHGGVEKTYARLAARYVWPNMRHDVERYIQSCRSCRVNKNRTRAERGALSGHPIPEERWQAVQMDWITDLPVTAAGYSECLVIEDRVTKYAYFVAAKKTDTAEDTARRTFAAVFCVHGVPTVVISDRDRRFTSQFYGALMALMHIRQDMGTSYYHDFNGAVECLNKTVEVMLRHLLGVFPDHDFDELLPMVQWAYNTTVHSATKMTPYMALYGVEPRQPMNFVAEPGALVPPAVAPCAEHQAGVLAMARDALLQAQQAMNVYENKGRHDAAFVVGEHVFLSTANLGNAHFLTTVAKLRPRFCGPFRIVGRLGLYKYKLELPPKMKELHPVFHAALLWRAQPTPADMAGRLGDGVVFPPAVVPGEGAELLTHDDDGVEVFVMESIVARRHSGRGFKYLVKWVGYPPEDNTWMVRKDAVTTGAARMLDAFDAAEVAREAAEGGPAAPSAAAVSGKRRRSP